MSASANGRSRSLRLAVSSARAFAILVLAMTTIVLVTQPPASLAQYDDDGDGDAVRDAIVPATEDDPFRVACVNSPARPNICTRFLYFLQASPEFEEVVGHYVVEAVGELELLDSFDDYDMALVDPKTSVCLTAERNVAPIASAGEQDDHGNIVFDIGGVVFTRSGSGITEITQLKGKTIAATTTTDFSAVHTVFSEYLDTTGNHLINDAAMVC